jgi:hypothetical protein
VLNAKKGSALIAALMVSAMGGFAPETAHAEVGAALRAGTLGIGLDIDFNLVENLNARLGYSGYDYNRSFNNTNVTYDGKLKLSNPTALLDWYPFAGGFRISFGAVGSGTKVDATGRPSGNGTYQIGNNTYTAAQIGSLAGQFKFGRSVSPYVGIGFGNAVGATQRVSFLFDLGVVYAGTPDISLAAQCNPTLLAAACTQLQQQLQQDVAAEKQKLQGNLNILKWYPVIDLGVAYRF